LVPLKVIAGTLPENEPRWLPFPLVAVANPHDVALEQVTVPSLLKDPPIDPPLAFPVICNVTPEETFHVPFPPKVRLGPSVTSPLRMLMTPSLRGTVAAPAP
jgi:hypothetical protein